MKPLPAPHVPGKWEFKAGGPDFVSEQGRGASHAGVACGGFDVSGCKSASPPYFSTTHSNTTQ